MNSETYPCFGARSLCRRAFTLIELLTVMAIIVVLAGLVLGIVGYAQGASGRARTRSELKELETAINAYQGDNGTVPRTSGTDGLDARKSVGDSKDYKDVSLVLYQALSGYYYTDTSGAYKLWKAGGGAFPPDAPKIYKTFTPSQVNGGGTAPSAGGIIPAAFVVGVTDAFGGYYGYSTAYQKALETNINSTTAPTVGFNPTYDLWSTGGYGNPGKTYPSDLTTPDQRKVLWITNWSQ